MKLSIAYGATTTQGYASTQEDGFYMDPSKGLFLLASGVGGRDRGDKLVHELMQFISGELRAGLPQGLTEALAFGSKNLEQNFLNNILLSAHKKTFEENTKKEWLGRCAASLGIAWVAQNQLHLAACGACGIFLYREGRVRAILLAQQIQATANIPSNLLGFSADFQVQFCSIPFREGDVILLCSQGVLDAVLDAQEFFSSLFEVTPRQIGESLQSISQSAIHSLESLGVPLQNSTVLAFEPRLTT